MRGKGEGAAALDAVARARGLEVAGVCGQESREKRWLMLTLLAVLLTPSFAGTLVHT